MKINNEFTVHASIEAAWALLTDVEAIAPCMPGAQLTGVQPAEGDAIGEVYEGKVKVKMGPVVAEYKGTATFIEKDDEKYRGVIDAKGRDSRGQGNASAVITVQLREEGESTTVAIDTDLKISGKIAQFGAGMIQEVSEKLLGQFVGCLEGKLAAPAEPVTDEPVTAEPVTAEPAVAEVIAGEREVMGSAEASPASTIAPAAAPPLPTASAATAAAGTATSLNGTAPVATPAEPARRTFQASPEPEALDLLDLAGGAAFKRLVPVVIAGAAVVAAVIFFITRR